MEHDFKGKAVAITGGFGHLGIATAAWLGERGASVALIGAARPRRRRRCPACRPTRCASAASISSIRRPPRRRSIPCSANSAGSMRY